jgi:hypothetical protein
MLKKQKEKQRNIILENSNEPKRGAGGCVKEKYSIIKILLVNQGSRNIIV